MARRGNGSRSRALEIVLVFFFQAEDGIRDVAVTGVQTCALPIYAAYKPDLTQSPPNYRTCSAHKKKPGRLATRAESERKENCFNEPCAAWAPAKVSRRAHPQTCRSLRERYARE